ncbi:MAG: hypothetical protein QXF25_00320 [Candidatus Pacearchaeota archaeon]
MKRGKFVVIEGNDGTGKTVQTKLLVERLEKEGFSVISYSFPQYDQNIFAEEVKKCLEGRYGDPTKLDPYIASLHYACDRWKASAGIRNSLAEGKIVIANRYASANMGHQGAKFRLMLKKIERSEKSLRELAADPEFRKREEERYRKERESILNEQKEFYSWLREMEFGERGFGNPYPDLTVILNLDPRIAQQLKDKQRSIEGTKKDCHESNLEYLECVSETFKELARSEHGWKLVECGDECGGILTPQAIHEEIWKHCNEMLTNTYK